MSFVRYYKILCWVNFINRAEIVENARAFRYNAESFSFFFLIAHVKHYFLVKSVNYYKRSVLKLSSRIKVIKLKLPFIIPSKSKC